MAILVMTRELTHMFVHPEIPKLYHVVSTACKEGIISFRVSESPLEKFHCVSMFLMTIIEDLDRLVCICIVNYHLLV